MSCKVAFYANDSLQNIQYFEYYKQDIVALERAGCKVIVINRYRDIPTDCKLIFIWWWSYALVPVLFAKITGKFSIITGTFNYSLNAPDLGYSYQSRPRWQRILIALALKLVDANIFVNIKEYTEVVADFRLKNNNYFLPHSVQDDYYNDDAKKTFPPFILNIAWRGRKNLIRKGVPELIEGFKMFHDKNPSVKLVLAGLDGDGNLYLKELIERYDLKKSVIDVGAIDLKTKIKLLAEATIYIQPSYYEGFGLAIAEAMASSCAIISTNVGGIPYVTNGSARFVEVGSPNQICDALCELISSPILCTKMAKSAYVQAKSMKIDKKIDFYKKLIQSLGIT